MKKILPLIVIILLTVTAGYSQAPGIFNYQGVARNSVGNVLINQNINLRLTIHDATPGGAIVYQESRALTTNPFGLFNAQVGSAGATAVTGTIAGVNWAVGDKYIQVEIDPAGGTTFINIGTAQLASVPYSLYAASSTDLVLPFVKSQASATALFSITNTGTGGSGVFAVNNAAGAADALTATTNGAGTSWALRATSTGLQGAGIFTYNNAAGAANALRVSNNGSGAAVSALTTGTGNAGFFQNTNAANNADALFVSTNATGSVPSAIHGTAGTAGISVIAKKGVWGESDNGVGVYGTSNTSIAVAGTTVTGTAVSAFSFSTGTALSASSLTGVSGSFLSPAGNASTVVTATTAGTGITGAFDNSNAANTNNTFQVINANTANGAISPTTGGATALFVRKGAGLTNFITNPTALYASAADPAAGQSIASLGITNNGFGVAGISLNNGTAVLGQAVAPGGVGVFALNASTGYGLVTLGKVQIQGQGAGANKVLTSDATGNATWQPIPAGLGGSGTLNFIPKWTPNGTTLGNSRLFDDGTFVGIGTTTPASALDVSSGSPITYEFYHSLGSGASNSDGLLVGIEDISPAAWFFNYENTPIHIVTGGASIHLNPATNGVGINQGNPTASLDVNGTFKLTDGTQAAGNVLTSDAAGNASWTNPSFLNNVQFRVKGLTGKTIPSSTNTDINTWDASPDYNDGGGVYNAAAGTYTVSKAGLYQVNARALWNAATANGFKGIYLMVNGSYADGSASGFSTVSTYDVSTLSTSVKLAAGAVVKIVLYQNTGANQTVANFPSGYDSVWSLYLIR